MNPSRSVSTKEGIRRALEELIERGGPQTCRALVEKINKEYRISRVNVDKDRAAQYLIRNPNIVVVGDITKDKIHVYGLRGVDYTDHQIMKEVG
ncbi:unnamed protein product [uncultured archaeal virus]|jgi:hypothetical protein|uniref:Uncharacterized protein n=1 Tax=uncultured archaeal virus TaxID=1960247 RepID=A0ABM9HVP6_9VIRU|nr:unnamed protein product [uncultured archaeal virus]CAI3524024.1 unnamed protein product [uncultured archaeal virus]CAI4043405.1 unnamed protein product [uncultured archaeal virus]